MKKQTAGRDNLGEFAPKFAELNDDVLFGEVWSREDKLSLRDRSLVTICVFMGKGLFDSSLKHHLMNAKNNGITKQEMAEIITHAAFYAGWPNAWAVFNMAKEVYADDDTKEEHGGIFGQGEPNTAFAQYFIGNSYLKHLTKPGESAISIANVTFEPKARTNWHKHSGGQILLVTAGRGYYKEKGQPARELKKGDVVKIPPNVEHWHGAAPDCWFAHISLETNIPNNKTTWLAPVTDEQYHKEVK